LLARSFDSLCVLFRRESCEALTDIACANDWSVMSDGDVLPSCETLPASALSVAATPTCLLVDLFAVTPDKISGSCPICRRHASVEFRKVMQRTFYYYYYLLLRSYIKYIHIEKNE